MGSALRMQLGVGKYGHEGIAEMATRCTRHVYGVEGEVSLRCSAMPHALPGIKRGLVSCEFARIVSDGAAC